MNLQRIFSQLCSYVELELIILVFRARNFSENKNKV